MLNKTRHRQHTQITVKAPYFQKSCSAKCHEYKNREYKKQKIYKDYIRFDGKNI